MKIINFYESKINIPNDVNVKKENDFLIFSGPLGTSKINLFKLGQKGCAALSLTQETINIVTPIRSVKKKDQSFIKCLKSLIESKINGVRRGFLVYLRIVGIGYRASLENETLILKVGFSHDVKYKIPSSVRVFLIEPTLICLFGIDKNQVTQIAAKIRQIKPPSPYKGKGIRLLQETITLKQGKQK